ncbi:hypothetical protein PV325_007048 [Microctonus aethiopoides]|uniref:Partner of Y14 and mago n=1 Tax=Microctonus aethiopoides TaxID=144406 RepID=A0AA39FKC8_9HYME|nr:hypothetical protein PV325_007048 [Microctonus aethiopoides]KAK0092056.1 hypothetical protein PV326_002291 [Microctonus aethiopoides]KAK0171016.1 hypothetical protein PV328_008784 [Microctonus aethiopoides]
MATSYIKDDEGGTFIPASQRPDGTWRKPRRVKDGYVPQEEVPLYESLGKQFQKNKLSYPVGMSAEYVAAHKAKVEAEQRRSTIPGMVIVNETKNKKKKKNKSKNVNSITENLANVTISEASVDQFQAVSSKSTSKLETVTKATKLPAVSSYRQDGNSILSESMKRLKNLRKKIREIESLESKIKNGDIKNPEKEVLDKISRKKDILDDIKFLESNQ